MKTTGKSVNQKEGQATCIYRVLFSSTGFPHSDSHWLAGLAHHCRLRVGRPFDIFNFVSGTIRHKLFYFRALKFQVTWRGVTRRRVVGRHHPHKLQAYHSSIEPTVASEILTRVGRAIPQNHQKQKPRQSVFSSAKRFIQPRHRTLCRGAHQTRCARAAPHAPRCAPPR